MNDIEKALERLKKADKLSKEDREEFLFEYLELCCISNRQYANNKKWQVLANLILKSGIDEKNATTFIDRIEKHFKDKEIPLEFIIHTLFYLFCN